MKTIRQVSEFLFLYWFNNIFLIYCLKEVKDALGDSCYDRVIHNSSKTTDILCSTFFVFQIIFLHPWFIDFSIVFLILIVFKLFVKLKSNWKLCRYLYAMTYLAVKIANSISIIENDLLIVYKFQKVPGKIRNISLVRIPDKVSNYYYYFWFGWQYTWWKHFIKIIIYIIINSSSLWQSYTFSIRNNNFFYNLPRWAFICSPVSLWMLPFYILIIWLKILEIWNLTLYSSSRIMHVKLTK